MFPVTATGLGANTQEDGREEEYIHPLTEKLHDTVTRLKANDAGLTAVELSVYEYDNDDVQTLAEAIKWNTCLTHFKLISRSANYAIAQLSDNSAQVLGDAFERNASLTQLGLSLNLFSEPGARVFTEAVKRNTHITALDLNSNQLNEPHAKVLDQLLKLDTCLTSLNVGNTRFGEFGVQTMARILKRNTSLTTLDLACNWMFVDLGSQAVAEALKLNTTLTCLNLRCNVIDGAGALALIGALKLNTALIELKLGNVLDEFAMTTLADALSLNTSLTELDLSDSNSDSDIFSTCTRTSPIRPAVEALLTRNREAATTRAGLLFNEGRRFIAMGKTGQAATLFQYALRLGIKPQDRQPIQNALDQTRQRLRLFDAHVRRGQAYLREANYARASLAFEEVLFQCNDHVTALQGRADVQAAMQLLEAEARRQQALRAAQLAQMGRNRKR